MIQKDLYVVLEPKFYDINSSVPPILSLCEYLKENDPPRIRDVIHYLLFNAEIRKKEIDVLVKLFKCYTLPTDTFAVMVNDKYYDLEKRLLRIKPRNIVEKIKGYNIIFSSEARDGGGYESRTERKRRMPFPIESDSNDYTFYYSWKASVNAYERELEGRVAFYNKIKMAEKTSKV